MKWNEAMPLLVGKRKDGTKVNGEINLVLQGGAWKVASQGYDR